MHSVISDWCSEEMYEGRVRPHPSAAGRLLIHLPHVHDAPTSSSASAGAAASDADAKIDSFGASSTAADKLAASPEKSEWRSSGSKSLVAASASAAGEEKEDPHLLELCSCPMLFIDTAGCGMEEVKLLLNVLVAYCRRWQSGLACLL